MTKRRRETRASPEDPRVPVSAESFLQYFGIETGNLPPITIERALQVPAFACGVAFLSRTLATLPLHAYRRTKDGAQRINGKLEIVVHENPNPTMDSFKFRQYFWQQVFTGGRGMAWIERSASGYAGIENIWPLDPARTSIERTDMQLIYRFAGKEYPAEDVIDIPFMLRPNQTQHFGPVNLAKKALQLALAMGDYAANFFAGGGVPPLALIGPTPQGAEALKRSMNDVSRVIDAAKKSDKPLFPLPPGHELKPVGFDPEKGQMVEARRFQVEEIARALQMPPVFLQDLTRATFTNSEQQDLFLVKHLVAQWATALEGEMNLKIFGRMNNGRYVQHNLDGLMRGDLTSRMTALSQAVQNGIRTPDEARELETLPRKGGAADKLYIQGATVPLGSNDGAANNADDTGTPVNE